MLKHDADWKVKRTAELIEMLSQMTLLHFKDLKRALYGEGNYRLYGKYKKKSFPRSVWKSFDGKLKQKFSDFLRRKEKPKMKVISFNLHVPPSPCRP